jgi:hypothetical protein
VLFEGFPLQVFHHDERLAVMLTNVIDRADMRVIQCRSGSGFTLKTLLCLRIVEVLLGENFESYAAAQTSVFGLVYKAHSSASEFLQYAVMRYRLPFHAALQMPEVTGSIVGHRRRRGNGNHTPRDYPKCAFIYPRLRACGWIMDCFLLRALGKFRKSCQVSA